MLRKSSIGDFRGLVVGGSFIMVQNPANFGGDPGGYNTWRSRFANTSFSGSASIAAAVPEPTGFALIALFAAFASSVLHRNRTLKDTQRD
jgi:hypothetical protein